MNYQDNQYFDLIFLHVLYILVCPYYIFEFIIIYPDSPKNSNMFCKNRSSIFPRNDNTVKISIQISKNSSFKIKVSIYVYLKKIGLINSAIKFVTIGYQIHVFEIFFSIDKVF